MLYWLTSLSDGGDFFNLFRYITFRAGAAFFTALIFGFLFGRPLIDLLRRRQGKGQPIRDDGPQGHFVKAGTPTMGGILILSALFVSTLLWARLDTPYVWIVLAVTIAFGAIGFADDYAKVTKQTSKGVSSRVRFLLGLAIAALAGIAAAWFHPEALSSQLALPVFKDVLINLGWFFVPFAMIVIVGAANAVNLTDGLDGLAVMPVMIAAGTFGVIAYFVGNANFSDYLGLHFVPGTGEIIVFCSALIGGGLGFLWYNAPPAAVFMGDTGSLALGGALGAISVVTKHEIVLAIVGGLFVVEALSVIIQVALLQAHRPARVPDGPDPPPFRKEGLGRAADRDPVLDHLADPGADRAGDAEAEVRGCCRALDAATAMAEGHAMPEFHHEPSHRPMRLTAALAARVQPYDGPPLDMGSGRPLASEDDHAAVYARLMSTRPADGQVWLFAYGSLIWKPNFAHDAECLAQVHGWHRAFCLGWMRAFRGSPDRPGLMMALDRGGSCRGVGFRLPAGQVEENLMPIIRRELVFKTPGMKACWLRGRTAEGPRDMIAFPVNRRADDYVTSLTEDRIVAALATSAGPAGSMADYLHSTVSHLEQRGIRDAYLWRMQELVADRIERAAEGRTV